MIYAVAIILLSLSACARIDYFGDVLANQKQGQACYLKCWSKGHYVCDVTENPQENYYFNKNDSLACLMAKYQCRDESALTSPSTEMFAEPTWKAPPECSK